MQVCEFSASILPTGGGEAVPRDGGGDAPFRR